MSRIVVGSLMRNFGSAIGGTTPPLPPVVSVTDNGDGTGALVTILGTVAGSLNTVYVQRANTTDWVNVGSRSENGTLNVNPGTGSFWFKVVSITDGGSATSNIAFSQITMDSDNPLSQTFNKLWEMFESDSHFQDMFPVNNRVKYNSNERNPLKEEVTSADMPEVALICDGITGNLISSSSGTTIEVLYSLVVNTGDFRVNVYTNKINWLVLCNLVRWRSVLTTLTWKEKTFIKNLFLNDISVGQSKQLRDRGIRGWSTVWSCRIQMHFTTNDITFLE